MRAWWLFAGLAGAGLFGFAVAPARVGQAVASAAIVARAGVDRTQELPDGLSVALCGTGSPLPEPGRAGPCSVIIAGRLVFMVDAGEGGARNMALMGIPNGAVEAIFLTHLHSDHIDGLPTALLLRWTGAHATAPLPVYGPAGTATVVAGFGQAARIDQGFRTAHHGARVAPPSGGGGTARVFALPPRGNDAPVRVFAKDGLTVTAFRVDHGPVEPAVGYRFDYKGRSIVFSGDTKATPAIVRNARGADLLVHEGIQPRLTNAMTRTLEARHQPELAKITRDILTYHATPEQVADEAQAAEVRHLIFSHVLPQLPSRLIYPAFLGDARRHFGGTMTVGEDGMVFTLPVGQTGMSFARWPVR